MISLPPVPDRVKHIAHFLKVADEHDNRNIVISYWSRMFACQAAMNTISGNKPPEVTTLLLAIMDWLEKTKKANQDLDGITNDTCAQALIEEYCLQLFNYADAQDKAEVYNKNVIKAFYTCGILMDVLTQFGPLSDEFFQKKKYSKWKAAHIHNCLKRGEKPTSGPPRDRIVDSDEEDDDEDYQRIKAARKNIPMGGFNNSNFSQDPNESNEFELPPPPSEDPVEPLIPLAPAPTIPSPPSPSPPTIAPPPAATPTSSGGAPVSIGPEQIEKAQKYCKYAGSALNYDDVTSAVDNLQKALHLLQFGKEK